MRVNQYPIRLEACKGLEPLINTAMQYGLLGEYQSELNTPILPVKKPHFQVDRLAWKLRAINQIIMNIYIYILYVYLYMHTHTHTTIPLLTP